MDRHEERYFGEFGGRFIPEVLRPVFEELELSFAKAMEDEAFLAEYEGLARSWIGRPTALCFAGGLTRRIGGPRIYLKLEGSAHTGAHKINNALGQALLAKRTGKKRVIAETGAGQH
ncbi:MAG: tryptophan synthase subunit beta, partial [Spirochaetota bacterium]